MIKDVLITKLDVIDTPGGNVMHGMKETGAGYAGFGEAYFSIVDTDAIKAWKRHHEMVLNLIVPVGTVRFVLFDDRSESTTCGEYQEVILSRNNYQRLTVPPMLWMGFQGGAEDANILLNVASVPHRPDEVDRLALEEIEYHWEK